jgi:regulator of replication initiation timing
MTDLPRFTYLINQCLRFLWTRDQQEEIQRLANEVLKENEQLQAENERLKEDLASETRWAKHYLDKYQEASADAERLATAGNGLLTGLVFSHYRKEINEWQSALAAHDARKGG